MEKSNDAKQRKPTQERAKARVEAIINATRELIQEKGSSSLKIQEIAERAGVTAGSMYQYFPNKQAILKALYEQYNEQVQEMMAASASGLESIDELSEAFKQIYSQYYALFLDAPVLQDIVASRGLNKELNQQDIEDSRQNSAVMFEGSKHLFDEVDHETLAKYLFLMVHLSSSMMQFAVSLEAEESKEMFNLSKKLISEQVIQAILKEP
ncbi:MAG: TetR/AcrR family transcriptional regulator [Chloroflexota bacterium]